jgi:alkylhydroperoxidase family enzyme
VLEFSNTVIEKVGKVSDDDLNKIRQAGFSDEEILEIVANVSLNILTNSLNNLAEPLLDFPSPEK